MVQKFDEFLEEIEQDIRQDKVEKYWNKYGKAAIGFASVCVLFTAGYMLYANQQTERAVKASETLVSAQDSFKKDNFSEGMSLLNHLITDSPKIYTTLGKFQKASQLAKIGPEQNVAAAIKIYDELMADRGNDQHLRDLAALMKISVQFDSFASDKTKMNQARIALKPLMDDKNPLHLLAKELNGVILFKVEAYNEAAEYFIKIVQDEKTPETLRSRAQLMAQMIASKQRGRL